MLARLTPKQISDFWPLIKRSVGEARPPSAGDGPDRDNNILQSLLSNRMDCWGEFEFGEDTSLLKALMITTFTRDDCAGTRQLMIYSICSFNKITMEDWRAGLEKLKNWARASNCISVIAYSNNQHIIKVAESAGGDCSYRLLSFNCGQDLTAVREEVR